MKRSKAIVIHSDIPPVVHHEMMQPYINVARQVAPSSQRIYKMATVTFNAWLLDHNQTLATVERDAMIEYKEYLLQNHAKATAARMWSTARQLLLECYHGGHRSTFPISNIKGFKLGNESPHIALSTQQVKTILDGINRSASKGKRDYALFLLLVRTGLRRKECELIDIGDFFQEQGHTFLTIKGKGDKRRKVKIPVDVLRALEEYVKSTGRTFGSLADPLFIGFNRGQHPTSERMGERTIERTVIECGKIAGIDHLTPHDLRTTFNTLAKKGGANLEQRQHAMGHARPETTQRYDKDKEYVDDNAVDHIHI